MVSDSEVAALHLDALAERAGFADAAPPGSDAVRTTDFDELLPSGNAALARQSDEVIAHYLAQIEGARASSRLRCWLIDRLPAGEPTEEAAARSLGMSLRNLQRRLEDERTTYRQVLNDTRESMARAYLEDGHTSVTEIAFLLGFADTSSFCRAFRRWTDISPRTYSKQASR